MPNLIRLFQLSDKVVNLDYLDDDDNVTVRCQRAEP